LSDTARDLHEFTAEIAKAIVKAERRHNEWR
jgi:hypothetical protein